MSHETIAAPHVRGAHTGGMKSVTLSEAKARIKALLRLARNGETIVITSRGKSVAEIGPPAAPSAAAPDAPQWSEALLRAEREGRIVLPKRRLNLKRIRATRESLPKGAGVLDALLADREEGR